MTHIDKPTAVAPAELALQRVLAARRFIEAAAEELDEAIEAARRVGCPDRDIGLVLGQTSEAVRQRRLRIAERQGSRVLPAVVAAERRRARSRADA